MARAKTPKQLQISINSLKKKITKLEAQKKRSIAAIKRKPTKKKVVRKKAVKQKSTKRRSVKKKVVRNKKRR